MGLAVEDLTVVYPGAGRPAVDHVAFEVADGQVLALLGPSGCGKSSILRAIAGLTSATGDVAINGSNLADVPTHRRHVGLMFQSDALFPHMDVASNVAFGCRMQRWEPTATAERVEEVLTLVGMGGMGARDVGSLTGGEQQRIALARTIAPRPGVLMLDEPLSSIDRAMRDDLLAEFPRVFEEAGATVVYVTHDQHEALLLADRVAVMDAGRILQIGTPREVWTEPADERVEAFLGPRHVIQVEVHDGHAITPLGPVDAGDVPDGPATVILSAGSIRVLV